MELGRGRVAKVRAAGANCTGDIAQSLSENCSCWGRVFAGLPCPGACAKRPAMGRAQPRANRCVDFLANS